MRVSRAFVVFFSISVSPALADPLPSWNDTPTKAAIIDFVETTTAPGSDAYVDPSERIATFDNDGTLWAEQPYYFQIAYALDEAKRMSVADPAIAKNNPAIKAAVERDINGLLTDGLDGVLELLAITHSGMTTGKFQSSVAAWLETAKHPETGERYTDLVYQPMLELLSYLRESGFKTYIVSGGGIDFIRVFSEDAYGIPPEQIVGSSVRTKFEVSDETAETVKLPELFFFDDNEGKPVAIDHHIGRRPIIAVGNSDGDQQMLQYATRSARPGLGIIVHHTDAEREWAYDRDAKVGHLDKALDEAGERDWVVVDMKSDWRTIFPSELRQ